MLLPLQAHSLPPEERPCLTDHEYLGGQVVIAALLCFCSHAFAQVSHHIRFSAGDVSIKTVVAGDGSSSQKISFTGLQWIDDAGKPELPVKLVRLALPQGQQVKSISIT